LEKIMPVLTQYETDILIGKRQGSADHRWKARIKLDKFQESKTDRNHVNAIDDLIPAALEFARNAAQRHLMPFDRAFHGEMNRLARKAGLRGTALATD
jgi:hypothetical protein